MNEHNIQMHKKNGDEWDKLYPLTKNENVFASDGKSLVSQLAGMNQLITTNKTDIMNNNNTLMEFEETKMKQQTNIIHLADFKKLSNETDDQHIQRALNSLTGEGYGEGRVGREGTLILEGKEYFLKGTIHLSKYQLLKGAGRATVLHMKKTSDTIINLPKDDGNYVYGVSVENLTVYGNGYNIGIDLKNATHVTLRNLLIYDTDIGVKGDDVWLAHYDRVTVRNIKRRGEYGFKIDSGTSNVYTATWAAYVKKGYQMYSGYSMMNSPACDNFTEYAYSIGQNGMLNTPGAEQGILTDGGCVFEGLARGITINSPLVMDITSNGTPGKASIFRFNGTQASVLNFRLHGTIAPKNLTLCIALNAVSAHFENPDLSQRDETIPLIVNVGAMPVVTVRSRTELVSYRGQADVKQLLVF